MGTCSPCSPPRFRLPGNMSSTVSRLLDVSTISHEPEAIAHPRGRDILARFPDAELIEVESHWRIPGLFGNEGNVGRWNCIKSTVLVLSVKRSLAIAANGRSTDFLAPSTSNGCAMACAYCYLPRNKGYANPISIFVNADEVVAAIRRHADRQGPKLEPNQVENAKGSFATKFVNSSLLAYDPQGKIRMRFSLMPAETGRILDVRTTPMHERIAAMEPFHDAGWEVQVNFSPVVIGEGWLERYDELFTQIDDTVAPRVKDRLACEVIFLTHNARLHEVKSRVAPNG